MKISVFVCCFLLFIVNSGLTQTQEKNNKSSNNHSLNLQGHFNYFPLDDASYRRYHLGGGLSASYSYKQTVGIGAYFSQNSIRSQEKKHTLFAVGGQVEISFLRATKDFFLTPIFINRIGYSKERYLKEDLVYFKNYSYREGITYEYHVGLRSNLEQTQNIQFGLTYGLAVYVEKLLGVFYTSKLSTHQLGAHVIMFIPNTKR